MPRIHRQFNGHFQITPLLRTDGSNFASWYDTLRSVLKFRDLLHIIDDPMGDRLGGQASQDVIDNYFDYVDSNLLVRSTILSSMEPLLRPQVFRTSSSDMISELKDLFIEELFGMRFEWMNRFFSTSMEENTSLGRHLARMQRIHERLTGDLGYWMTDELAIDGVLRSLPPSYHDHVIYYARRKQEYTFPDLMAELQTLKVEPVAGEIID
jgi:hypothetical protein